MKRLWAVLFLCAGAALPAQELSDVRLYFAPAIGGYQAERDFFTTAVPGEIRSPYYVVVDNPEDADFLVSMTIAENGKPDESASFTLGLTTHADVSPLLEISWDYVDVEEMYTWDIGSILAPGPSGAPALSAARGNERRLYLGLRGGLSRSERFFQTTAAYDAGMSAGISVEGGLVAELRLLRFLSLQAEADFVYEAFAASRVTVEGSVRAHSTERFSSLSIMVPLVAKVPLRFGRFALSPYAGVYGIAIPWQSAFAVRTDPPFGFAAGMELGFPLGSGELFADLRQGNNFGMTVSGDGEGPQYAWSKLALCFGYRFGFLNREQVTGNR